MQRKLCWLGVITLSGLVVLSASGCGRKSPTEPAPAVDLSGTWSGTGSDNTGPGELTLTLVQDRSSVTGSFIAHDTQSGEYVAGTISGNLSGYSLEGNFSANYSGCTVSFQFTAIVSGTQMAGTYEGTNTCSGAITGGSFTLTRH